MPQHDHRYENSYAQRHCKRIAYVHGTIVEPRLYPIFLATVGAIVRHLVQIRETVRVLREKEITFMASRAFVPENTGENGQIHNMFIEPTKEHFPRILIAMQVT